MFVLKFHMLTNMEFFLSTLVCVCVCVSVCVLFQNIIYMQEYTQMISFVHQFVFRCTKKMTFLSLQFVLYPFLRDYGWYNRTRFVNSSVNRRKKKKIKTSREKHVFLYFLFIFLRSTHMIYSLHILIFFLISSWHLIFCFLFHSLDLSIFFSLFATSIQFFYFFLRFSLFFSFTFIFSFFFLLFSFVLSLLTFFTSILKYLSGFHLSWYYFTFQTSFDDCPTSRLNSKRKNRLVMERFQRKFRGFFFFGFFLV